LEPETIAGLEALIAVGDERERTPLAWLREWPEAPGQKNLAGLVERLQLIRKLGLSQDRETTHSPCALHSNCSGNSHSQRSASLTI
jgi:hypothetical protein